MLAHTPILAARRPLFATWLVSYMRIIGVSSRSAIWRPLLGMLSCVFFFADGVLIVVSGVIVVEHAAKGLLGYRMVVFIDWLGGKDVRLFGHCRTMW